jgi:hypothetical protein
MVLKNQWLSIKILMGFIYQRTSNINNYSRLKIIINFPVTFG